MSDMNVKIGKIESRNNKGMEKENDVYSLHLRACNRRYRKNQIDRTKIKTNPSVDHIIIHLLKNI